MKTTIKTALDTIEKEISSVRASISKVQNELEQVSIARITTKEAKEDIIKYLNDQAGRYKGFDLIVDNSLKTDTSIAGQVLIEDDSRIGRNLTPFLCSFFYDNFKEILFKKIDDKNIPEGLPQKEREKRIENLNKELWSLGITEENIISEAEDAGYYIPRRRNCNPKIVLEYREVG